MYRMKSRLACLITLVLVVGGCGAITPSSLLMKGAMWAGEQVIKKELKKRTEHKHADGSDEPQPYRHKRTAARRPNEFGGPPASSPSH